MSVENKITKILFIRTINAEYLVAMKCGIQKNIREENGR